MAIIQKIKPMVWATLASSHLGDPVLRWYEMKRVRQWVQEPDYRAKLLDLWWFYSVELAPGVMAKGMWPHDLAMIPRLMMRRCDLQGASCLDLGSMEALVPVLMCRAGAAKVVATEHSNICRRQVEVIKAIYNVRFDYKIVGLMYDLHRKLRGESFDFVNCSGLLYHVWSPITVLAGLRPLLKRNGLIIVTTHVALDDKYVMYFNHGGYIQDDPEGNTFWYISIRLFEYILHYLRLSPIDALFQPHDEMFEPIKGRFKRPGGYISVLCRAVDELIYPDEYMVRSSQKSWEYRGLCDWALADRQPRSTIKLKNGSESVIHLAEFVQSSAVPFPVPETDAHVLHLSDAE